MTGHPCSFEATCPGELSSLAAASAPGLPNTPCKRAVLPSPETGSHVASPTVIGICCARRLLLFPWLLGRASLPIFFLSRPLIAGFFSVVGDPQDYLLGALLSSGSRVTRVPRLRAKTPWNL